MTLLLTPKLANLLHEDSKFISNVMKEIFYGLPRSYRVDVLAAIVDEIAVPPKPGIAEVYLGDSITCHGQEGLSIRVSELESTATNLWSPGDRISQRHSEEDTATLSFSFVTHGNSDVETHPDITVSRTVQLPLANTLFQNGLPSTMLAQSWELMHDPDSNLRWVCTKRMNLKHQELIIRNRIPASLPVMHIPRRAVNLGPPRIVAEAMGNIIRSFQAEADPRRTMHASADLENSITQLPRLSTAPSPHDAEIWAQVTPRESWSDHPSCRSSDGTGTSHEVERGDRLHRVISGGGGWGNKHGLISLDPDVNFGESSPLSEQPSRNTQALDASHYEALRAVVRPGDVVQFRAFLQTSDRPAKPTNVSEHTAPRARVPKARGGSPLILTYPNSLWLGSTLPEPDDARSDARKTAKASAPKYSYLIYDGHFGALAEMGLGYKLTTQGNGTHWGARRLGNVVETKLPSLSSVHFQHAKPQSETTAWSNPKITNTHQQSVLSRRPLSSTTKAKKGKPADYKRRRGALLRPTLEEVRSVPLRFCLSGGSRKEPEPVQAGMLHGKPEEVRSVPLRFHQSGGNQKEPEPMQAGTLKGKLEAEQGLGGISANSSRDEQHHVKTHPNWSVRLRRILIKPQDQKSHERSAGGNT
jgi:hypothetical protein